MLLLSSQVWAGTTHFISPTGSDAADGLTLATAWASVNHAGLTCGDAIMAGPGSYGQIEVTTQPTCAVHNAVWVKCITFDTCKISITSDPTQSIQGAIAIRASNWAFTGWETTTSSVEFASCFVAIPTSATVGLHDVYFINDIGNGCIAGAFNFGNNATVSVDYLIAIADVAWNASQGSQFCWSGVNVLQPQPSDTLPGTHIYFSQIFAWNNVEPAMCDQTPSTDGEGIIFDTFNGIYQDFPAYDQQAVITDSITFGNGAAGIGELGSGNKSSRITISHNTVAYNFVDSKQNTSICGQINHVGFSPTGLDNKNRLTNIYDNIAVAESTGAGCGTNPAYAVQVGNVDQSSAVYRNRLYSPVGQNIGSIGTTTGFVAGPNNLIGTDPAFANPTVPGAPNCTGKASVIDCMSSVIAGFTPTASGFTGYGYRPVSLTPTNDPLFPKWLCNNPNMPTGVVTMGCLNVQINGGVKIQ